MHTVLHAQVGHQLVSAYAACSGLPLVRQRITGATRSQALAYTQTPGDEVEDLYRLLAFVKVRVYCSRAGCSARMRTPSI